MPFRVPYISAPRRQDRKSRRHRPCQNPFRHIATWADIPSSGEEDAEGSDSKASIPDDASGGRADTEGHPLEVGTSASIMGQGGGTSATPEQGAGLAIMGQGPQQQLHTSSAGQSQVDQREMVAWIPKGGLWRLAHLP